MFWLFSVSTMEKNLPTRNRHHRSARTFECPFCDEFQDLVGHDNRSKILSRHISEHVFKSSSGKLLSKATKNEINLQKLQKKIGYSSRTEAIGIIVQLRELGDDSLKPAKGEFSTQYSQQQSVPDLYVLTIAFLALNEKGFSEKEILLSMQLFSADTMVFSKFFLKNEKVTKTGLKSCS